MIMITIKAQVLADAKQTAQDLGYLAGDAWNAAALASGNSLELSDADLLAAIKICESMGASLMPPGSQVPTLEGLKRPSDAVTSLVYADALTQAIYALPYTDLPSSVLQVIRMNNLLPWRDFGKLNPSFTSWVGSQFSTGSPKEKQINWHSGSGFIQGVKSRRESSRDGLLEILGYWVRFLEAQAKSRQSRLPLTPQTETESEPVSSQPTGEALERLKRIKRSLAPESFEG